MKRIHAGFMQKLLSAFCVVVLMASLTGCAGNEKPQMAERAARALLTCPTAEMTAYLKGEKQESPEEFVGEKLQAADFTQDGLRETVNMLKTSWLLDGACAEANAAVSPKKLQTEMQEETLCVVMASVSVETKTGKTEAEIKLRVQFDKESGKIRYISFDEAELTALYALLKN